MTSEFRLFFTLGFSGNLTTLSVSRRVRSCFSRDPSRASSEKFGVTCSVLRMSPVLVGSFRGHVPCVASRQKRSASTPLGHGTLSTFGESGPVCFNGFFSTHICTFCGSEPSSFVLRARLAHVSVTVGGAHSNACFLVVLAARRELMPLIVHPSLQHHDIFQVCPCARILRLPSVSVGNSTRIALQIELPSRSIWSSSSTKPSSPLRASTRSWAEAPGISLNRARSWTRMMVFTIGLSPKLAVEPHPLGEASLLITNGSRKQRTSSNTESNSVPQQSHSLST